MSDLVLTTFAWAPAERPACQAYVARGAARPLAAADGAGQ
jgi:hypothetical protein